MKSAIILLIVPIIQGTITPMYEVNGSSESEINCYEKGFRAGEEHHLTKIHTMTVGVGKDQLLS
jgi:hypothetical protein